MKEKSFKEGDIIHDGILGYWIFFNHNKELRLYPYDKFNNGKLSEGECSFIHNPKTWDLSKVKIGGNIIDTPKLKKYTLD